MEVFLPANIHPADHMSIEVEYSLAPNSTSGGLYHNVTTWSQSTWSEEQGNADIVQAASEAVKLTSAE